MRALFCLLLCLLAPPAWAADPEVSWDDMREIKAQSDNRTAVEFAPALTALNGKEVTIDGWMTPFNLGDGDTVKQFLLTGTPGTCPFCQGLGPESFMLINAAEPVPIDITGEFVFRGRFKLTRDDQTGFYYQLEEAHLVSHH